MVNLLKFLGSLRHAELTKLATDEGIDISQAKTAPDIRQVLALHFTANTERLEALQKLTISVDTQPVSPNPNTSSNTDPQPPNFPTFDLNAAFANLATALKTCAPPQPNVLIPVLDTLRARKITFSGKEKENFSEFLKAFNNICDLYGVNDQLKLKLIVEVLESEPLLLIKANSDSLPDWSSVVSLLKGVYQRSVSDYTKKIALLSRTQLNNELIAVFITHLKELNSKLDCPLNGPELLDLAKTNIHPSFYEIVETNDPQSMDDLLECGRVIEKRRARRRLFMSTTQASTSSQNVSGKPKIFALEETEIETQPCELNLLGKPEKKLNKVKNWKNVATQTTEDNKACYNCGSFTHFIKFCPKVAKNEKISTQDFHKEG